jgi:putative isomerase
MTMKKQAWLEQYKNEKWLRLLDRAYDNIMANITCEGMPWSPLRGISPGRGTFFPGIWNWDTAFHAMCVSRWDTELAKECLWAFMQFQKENGMYPDVIWKDGGVFDGASKPPVLATYVLLTFERDGELAFLRKCFDSLKKNLEFWERERCTDEGLFYYSASADNAEEQDLWARWESGWDDSVRWDVGIEKLYPIDLQCYMITFYRAMQKMSEILGESCQDWANKEANLAQKINDLFFDETQGIYADIFKSDKQKSRVYSPASFMPLYIGIAPQAFAEKCAKFAKVHFYPAMPTVAYDDPCYVGEYWRGHTWLNVAYFAIKGLKNYHFAPLAEEMRNTILSYVDQNKEHIFEKYDADTGEGRGCPCFSWSSAFIIEFILNF